MSESSSVKPPSIGRRLFWLLLCTAIGVAVGVAGLLCTGDSVWLLALPIALAVGWLVLADPTECLPRKTPGRQPLTGLSRGRNDARDPASLRHDG